MAAVTGVLVAEFLGQADDPTVVGLASQAAPVITAMARAYTRGGGFDGAEPNDEVAAVITTGAARLAANPEQTETRVGSTFLRGGWQGWTLAEQIVLNRYRKRAQ